MDLRINTEIFEMVLRINTKSLRILNNLCSACLNKPRASLIHAGTQIAPDRFIAKLEAEAMVKGITKGIRYFRYLNFILQHVFAFTDNQVIYYMVTKNLANPTYIQHYYIRRIKKILDTGFELNNIYWVYGKKNISDQFTRLNLQDDLEPFLGKTHF